jgi:hypothetical protein
MKEVTSRNFVLETITFKLECIIFQYKIYIFIAFFHLFKMKWYISLINYELETPYIY